VSRYADAGIKDAAVPLDFPNAVPKAQLEQLAVHSKVPDEAVLVRAAQLSPAEPSLQAASCQLGRELRQWCSSNSWPVSLLHQAGVPDLRRSQEGT